MTAPHDVSPFGATVALTGAAIAVVAASYAAAPERSRVRWAALLLIAARVMSLPVQVSVAQDWERGRQPTPAPVESPEPVPACGPDQVGPEWLDSRWICIPKEQAG